MSVLRLLTKLGRSLPTSVTVHNADGDPSPSMIVQPGDETTVDLPEGGWVVLKVAGEADPEATIPGNAAKAKPAKASAKKK